MADLKKLKEQSRLQSGKELVKLIGKKEQEIKLWEEVEKILPLQRGGREGCFYLPTHRLRETPFLNFISVFIGVYPWFFHSS